MLGEGERENCQAIIRRTCVLCKTPQEVYKYLEFYVGKGRQVLILIY